ncbi:MAG: type II secretion system F family protein [Desulfobacterales bacterium]|nr:type II secretion system F family protein [Desulfobacterales bacterium]
MRKYTFQAIDEKGNKVTGEIEAESVEVAQNMVADKGYIPVKITNSDITGGGFSFQKFTDSLTPIKTHELIIFTKQYRTMLNAGISVLEILRILEAQTANPRFKKIISSMRKDIQEGSGLHEAFANYPEVFSKLYCGMIQAGEASGSLPKVLDRLTYIIEHEAKIKEDIKSALQYPVTVLCFLVIAFFILLTFVIPKFAAIFIKAGIKLPLPTKMCIVMYTFLKNYWFLLLGGIVGLIVFLIYYLKTEQGKYVRDVILIKLPIVGNLVLKASMSRFASIFAILQSSGVAILSSLKILSGTIGNSVISKEFDKLSTDLSEGKGIAEPLSRSPYFDPLVVNMVAIGEESGNLDEMLTEISKHFDSEVEYAMGRLSEAIGPILTVGLAAVVGFFALAIFLPMWDLTKMVK